MSDSRALARNPHKSRSADAERSVASGTKGSDPALRPPTTEHFRGLSPARRLFRRCFGPFEGAHMNWNQIEGQWHQLAGQIKSEWAKVTDDDLKNVAGK